MKHRDLIIVIIINLIAVGVLIVAIYFTNQQLGRVEKISAEIVSLEAKKRGLTETRRALMEIREDRLKLDEYVVTERNTDDFFNHLEVVASQTQVKMSIISAGVGNGLTVHLTARGSYSSIIRYLDLLSTIHYLINFDRINLQVVPDKSGVWVADIYLTLASFKK